MSPPLRGEARIKMAFRSWREKALYADRQNGHLVELAGFEPATS